MRDIFLFGMVGFGSFALDGFEVWFGLVGFGRLGWVWCVSLCILVS